MVSKKKEQSFFRPYLESVFISALSNALTPYQPPLRPLRAEWAPLGPFLIRGGY